MISSGKRACRVPQQLTRVYGSQELETKIEKMKDVLKAHKSANQKLERDREAIATHNDVMNSTLGFLETLCHDARENAWRSAKQEKLDACDVLQKTVIERSDEFRNAIEEKRLAKKRTLEQLERQRLEENYRRGSGGVVKEGNGVPSTMMGQLDERQLKRLRSGDDSD